MSSPRVWVWRFALLVMLVTCLPYLAGYTAQGQDWVFTGFVFGVEDGNSYIAKMLSGSAGAWLFRTPYTAASQAGVAAFLPYLLLGKLAAAPELHLQLAALYHLFRLGAGLLAIHATYDFLALFIGEERWRRLALSLAVLGGGAGWGLLLLGRDSWLGSLPLEFYSPETFGFLGLYGLPHLSLARACLLWGLRLFLLHAVPGELRTFSPQRSGPAALETNLLESVPVATPKRALGAAPAPSQEQPLQAGLALGGLWLVLALAQPVTAVLLGALLGLYLLVSGVKILRMLPDERPRFWQAWQGALRLSILGGLVVAPFLLYTTWSFWTDPFLKAWTAQNLILSPHPLHYLLAYGPLLPFALPGARRLLAEHPWGGLLPAAWVLALPVLAYAPLNLQRRLPEGVWVALCLLGVVGLQVWLERRRADREAGRNSLAVLRAALPALSLLLVFPSTLVLLLGGMAAASTPGQPLFRPAAEVRAFEFLASRARPGEVVLSAYASGNALPAWAPVRVVIGHGPESAGLAELEPQVKAFFQSDTPEGMRIAFLEQHQVAYVFYGPEEAALGAWRPQASTHLLEIYRDGEYAIFQVRR